MPNKAIDGHKNPSDPHKIPTEEKTKTRKQFFFDESHATPGPNEGKILGIAAGLAFLIIIAMVAGTIFFT